MATLTVRTEDKTVSCVGQERDQYGRLIARCSTDEYRTLALGSSLWASPGLS